jgi:hypothetical protein
MADKVGAGRVLFAGALLVALGTFITPYMTTTWGLILAIGVLSPVAPAWPARRC